MATSSVGQLNYDENLAESAPAATKAQKQSGYNPDLLKPTPSMSSRQDLTLPTTMPDVEKQSPPPKVPFYRTTKGILIILVAAAVVIGAVVGGAVGGTRHHGSNAVLSGQQGQSNGQSGSQSAGQGEGAPASGTSSASTSAVAGQQTVGAGVSTTSGSTSTRGSSTATNNGQQAQQTGGVVNVNPGGPLIPPITTGSSQPTPSSAASNQGIGLIADIGP